MTGPLDLSYREGAPATPLPDPAIVSLPLEEPQAGDGGAELTPLADGGLQVEFAPRAKRRDLQGWDANLADRLSEGERRELAALLLEAIEADLGSRTDWQELYLRGIEMLGLKLEERSQPFPGAANVHHTLMIEAVIRFQANARGEMLPAAGPVTTQIAGDATPELEQRAERVKNAFNHYLTEVATEYYPDFDQMLLYLPICGSTFKKVYWCPLRRRPVAPFVLPDDLIVSYTTTDIATSPRITHRTYPTRADVLRLQLAGFYSDVDLMPPTEQPTEAQQAVAEVEGRRPSIVEGRDDRHTLYEVHTLLDLPGFEHRLRGKPTGLPLPYIVTIDRDSETVLRIARNWDEGDPDARPRQYFVHYQFLPGLGFYGMGYPHLIGNTTRALTKIERQLLDAGTLANLPGGLIVKGLRIADNEVPVAPGEFREIETGGLPIGDAFAPLPYKEPSGVLAALMGRLEESGQRLAGTMDIAVGDGRQDAPVGSTIALIDQATRVMAAVHKRLHAAQQVELRMLKRVFAARGETSWPYMAACRAGSVTGADFADLDIVPVGDPNVPSQMQRQMRNLALLQMAGQAPELFDKRAVYLRALGSLGVDPDGLILPPSAPVAPADPVSENMAMVRGLPVAAGSLQDHDAHIAAHLTFAQNPAVQASAAAMQGVQAHIAEHLGLKYRALVEQALGQPLPPPGVMLPPQTELVLSRLVAYATQQIQMRWAGSAQQAGPSPAIAQAAAAQAAATAQAAQAVSAQNALKAEDLKLKQTGLMQKGAAGDQQARLQMAELAQRAASDAADRMSRERIAAMRMASGKGAKLRRAQGHDLGGLVGDDDDGTGLDAFGSAAGGAATADAPADLGGDDGFITPLFDADTTLGPDSPVMQLGADAGLAGAGSFGAPLEADDSASDASSSNAPVDSSPTGDASQNPLQPTSFDQAAVADCGDGEVALLARLIYAEAGNRSGVDGAMEGVGWVVRNRVGAPTFRNSIEAVIKQPGAFAAIGGDQWNSADDPASLTGGEAASYARACSVAKGVLDGSIPDPRPGSTFFYSGKIPHRFFESGLRSGRLVKNGEPIGSMSFLKEARPPRRPNQPQAR